MRARRLGAAPYGHSDNGAACRVRRCQRAQLPVMSRTVSTPGGTARPARPARWPRYSTVTSVSWRGREQRARTSGSVQRELPPTAAAGRALAEDARFVGSPRSRAARRVTKTPPSQSAIWRASLAGIAMTRMSSCCSASPAISVGALPIMMRMRHVWGCREVSWRLAAAGR
ncbi:hypothetical protein MRB53_041492 [Persea americana]|nr:hypothetical protein MRB53_041492 [Persea americana]